MAFAYYQDLALLPVNIQDNVCQFSITLSELVATSRQPLILALQNSCFKSFVWVVNLSVCSVT